MTDIGPVKLTVASSAKIPENSEKIATELEKIAADIRSGKDDTVAIHIVKIDPKGAFLDQSIGSIFVSTLIGYLYRTINKLARDIDNYNGTH